MGQERTIKILKRPAKKRGSADHGWLQARFTFSFGQYYDPKHMGFKSLRVMNNDVIQPGGGFATHSHTDMEIFTCVIEGQLEHRDSLGNSTILTPGKLQYMSAGKGIQHSEFNPSESEKTEIYQIWIKPKQRGGEPRYMEKKLPDLENGSPLTLLYSGEGRQASTKIRQDAEIFFGYTSAEKKEKIIVTRSNNLPHAWIQVISGSLSVFNELLETADGLAIENAPETFEIQPDSIESKFLLFGLS